MNRVLQVLKETFHENLPSSLYLSSYQLADTYGGNPKDWQSFLNDPDTQRFIEREIAHITEAAARKAIDTLSKGNSTPGDVSAIKELLNKSKIIQEKTNQRPTLILHHIPTRQETEV